MERAVITLNLVKDKHAAKKESDRSELHGTYEMKK
jgi:hypothetical protein